MSDLPITTNPSGNATLTEATITAFKAALRGQLLTTHDEGYDTARQVYNGMIDKHPALISRCADVADVMTAVNFARDYHLLLVVRGGGLGHLTRKCGPSIDNLLSKVSTIWTQKVLDLDSLCGIL